MRKRMAIIISIVFVIGLFLVAWILTLRGCSCKEIKYDEDNSVYWINGHPYSPVSQFKAKQIKRIPVGRLDGFGYILYPLVNDPDMLFIFPQDVLTMKRSLLARTDMALPDPAKDSVSRIEINGNTIDDESEEVLLSFFREGYKEEYKGNRYQYNTLYDIDIFFSDYPQVYYHTYIAQFEDVYCLLIDEKYYAIGEGVKGTVLLTTFGGRDE